MNNVIKPHELNSDRVKLCYDSKVSEEGYTLSAILHMK